MKTRVEVIVEALGIEIHHRRGTRGWALCPYHHDHTPTNFFIRLRGRRAGQVHCFACKQGGSLRELVMYVRTCDEDQANIFIELLGKGYEPPRRHFKVVERPARLVRSRFKMPREVIFEPLEKWVSLAKKYAIEQRELTAEEVDRYNIGYAVDGRLGGRIVVPWIDQDNRMVGYSARSFCDEEPKYLTPHERDHADLGTMFGEHTWTSRDTVVVTEGAFNAMCVVRALPDYRCEIAALGGSDVNPMHMIKLAEFSKVVIMTDSDPAGDKAAPAIASALGRYVKHLTRVRLPDKKDAQDVGPVYLRSRLVAALERIGETPIVAS